MKEGLVCVPARVPYAPLAVAGWIWRAQGAGTRRAVDAARCDAGASSDVYIGALCCEAGASSDVVNSSRVCCWYAAGRMATSAPTA